MAFKDDVLKEEQRIPFREQTLGRTLNQPFTINNSGSRKVLAATQSGHRVNLVRGELPIIQTGYENEFGEKSSSVIYADSDSIVLAKIQQAPSNDYYMLLLKQDGILDVIHRKQFVYNTESYGYENNTEFLDNINVGDVIHEGQILQRSTAFDEYGNRMDGVNLLTAFIANDITMEDGMVMSETAARRLAFYQVDSIDYNLNNNDIPINLYGDDYIHKSFPDIGEPVKDGIIMEVRREKIEDSLFMQSKSRLKTPMLSDDRLIYDDGYIAGIDIKTNCPDELREKTYDAQLYHYYQHRKTFNETVVNTLDKILAENPYLYMTYDCKELYEKCKLELGQNTKFNSGYKVFSGTEITFIAVKNNEVKVGDKSAERHAGKGVVTKIVPDEQMPLTEYGERVHVLLNQAGTINRENDGRLKEQHINMYMSRIIEYFKTGVLDTRQKADIILKFESILAKKQYISTKKLFDSLSEDELSLYIAGIEEDGRLYISQDPASEPITMDVLKELMIEFPWVKPTHLYTQIRDSNNNWRYVESKRLVVCGYLYMYRLKQFAEEKFSVVSLSHTNVKNENSRSKSNKTHRIPHKNTPIRFGNMEFNEFNHMDPKYVKEMLMMYASSPDARLKVGSISTEDPFDVNIKVDEESTDISVQFFNVLMKSIGLRTTFKKIPIKKNSSIVYKPIKYNHDNPLHKPITYVDKEERGFDIDKFNEDMIKLHNYKKSRPLAYRPIKYNVNKKKEE